MSSNSDVTRATPDSGASRLKNGVSKGLKATMGVGEAFIAFLNRGNVVDLAVGIVVGAAFTAIVTSFVNDLITPVIGLAAQKNMGNLFLVISCNSTSKLGCKTGGDHPYATILQATTDGAATWNYGNFIQAIINFILVALAMFFVVQVYSNSFLKKTKAPEAPTTKTCGQCAEDVPLKALKCKWCLSELPGSS
ncbi:large-conductance mechanosensitive channel [Obelidium mucronatum]|nr:large-conductance mechanosensitive channel [Obelidium mucronatum]